MPTLMPHMAIFSVHFTTFCDDTLEFYYFQDALSTAVIIDFAILLPRFKTDIYSSIRHLKWQIKTKLNKLNRFGQRAKKIPLFCQRVLFQVIFVRFENSTRACMHVL
jgi:hypothetical protein